MGGRRQVEAPVGEGDAHLGPAGPLRLDLPPGGLLELLRPDVQSVNDHPASLCRKRCMLPRNVPLPGAEGPTACWRAWPDAACQRPPVGARRSDLDGGSQAHQDHQEPRLRRDALVRIPAAVLTETYRGSRRDAGVDWIAGRGNRVLALDHRTSRVSGQLIGRNHLDPCHAVDATVVATAIRLGGAVVLTG